MNSDPQKASAFRGPVICNVISKETLMRAVLIGVMLFAMPIANADAPPKFSNEKCKELYQGWVFNRMLEELCEIGGVASRQIGMMAKSLCDDVLTEDDRNKYGLEVLQAFKKDFNKIGKEGICEIEVPRYNKMLESLYK